MVHPNSNYNKSLIFVGDGLVVVYMQSTRIMYKYKEQYHSGCYTIGMEFCLY